MDAENLRVRGLGLQMRQWQVIDFQSIWNIANTYSLFAECAGNNYDFVAELDQTLSHIVDVHFNTPKIWDEKITAHRYSQRFESFFSWWLLLRVILLSLNAMYA